MHGFVGWRVYGGAWGAWGWGRRERRILRSVALCYECNSPSGVLGCAVKTKTTT